MAESRPPTATSPSSHAKEAFTPILVETSPPSIQGPFIDTSSSHPPPEEGQGQGQGPQVIFGESDLEAGRKWNEERIERRLRGEYERAGKALEELVTDSLDSPLRLNSIRILGATKTRPSFLRTIFSPYLPQSHPQEPQSLRSLLSTTRQLSTALSSHGIFSHLSCTLEKPLSLLADPDDVDIVLRVKEASRYYLKTATDVGDGEGNASATARIGNALGGGETLEGNMSFGTRTKNAFQLKFDTPINADPTTRADFTIFSAQRDLNYYASCSEATRGLSARIRTLTKLGTHEFTYEATLRQLSTILPSASLSIRLSPHSTTKSSLSHTFTRDTRSDPFLSTSGSFLRLKEEYAGLGGDANFVKVEGEWSGARGLAKELLGEGYSVSCGARAGALVDLSGKGSLFVDRFQMGGPTNVRMFRPNSMGPRDNGDYIGGDLHWALGLSLITPFHPRPSWPLKSHFFLNAGRLTSLPSSLSPSSSSNLLINSIKSLISEPSITAGVGLMYRHSLVRVEMNLGVPLAMGAQEGAVKGLQFGLGLSFL
ncbi:hypothetical protein P7C70_g8810, partial [Phenoliferia sp. Uapishka_3]